MGMITMLIVAMLLIFGSLAMALVAAAHLWRTLGTAIEATIPAGPSDRAGII